MAEAKKTTPVFEPTVQEFVKARTDQAYTVLCGVNNSGKTFALKNVKRALGRKSYMVGAQRFYHLYHISTQNRNPEEYTSFENQFNSQFNNMEHNHEQNYIDLGKVLTGLNDKRRAELFDLCSEMVGNNFCLKRIEEDNELSMRYVDMDGQNLSVGSTGTRLLMTILGLCMDPAFETILIDEPELGLGPKIQTKLAEFFADQEQRNRYFPNVKSIYVATHSHLFLDRKVINNNFVVQKFDNTIRIENVDSFQKFHSLQFNLLGNSLESLFLPSAFVLVEGKTDDVYLSRWIQRLFPDKKILVIQTHGDPKQKVHALRESLGDIFKSPFRSRIFVVLDFSHNTGDVDALKKMGVLNDNIVIWDKNGIEYVYPLPIVAQIFGCPESQLDRLILRDDVIELNGVQRKKSELCDDVVRNMSAETTVPEELERKLGSVLT